jgi:hypothetical protein
VIYEHGNPWWDNIDREKVARSPEPSGNPTNNHLVENQEELAKKMDLALRGTFVHTLKVSLTCRKILRHGFDGFTAPPKEGVLRILIALKIPSPSAGFEPANLWFNGKNASHYTTQDD